MSVNPFVADPAVPLRLSAQDDAAVREAARAGLVHGVLDARKARALIDRFALGGPDDLMCHLLPLAEAVARPAISGFTVGAVGQGAVTGDLILGGNMEFAGTSLHHTLHAEGFVAIRAFQRGEGLARLAISEAHPCAHCRQVLTEFQGAAGLVLIDPLGHQLPLCDLYPWPFDPAYLGQAGAAAGQGHGRRVADPTGLPGAVLRLLTDTASHAPYSGVTAVLVLETSGGLVAGGSIESVAFNPSLTPIQTALVALAAIGGDPGGIHRGWLAQDAGGAVDHAVATAQVLTRVSPAVALDLVAWA